MSRYNVYTYFLKPEKRLIYDIYQKYLQILTYLNCRYKCCGILGYKQQRHLTGKQVYDHFKKYHFDDYILDLYELLHVQGTRRLMEELDEYQTIQEREVNANSDT